MHLHAISIGNAVPRIDFDAVVHSVFRSALNLCVSGERALLTLLISSEADLPQGIRLDTSDDFSFEIFQVGEPVTCREESLRINSLTIDLRDARRWKCDLSKLKFDSTDPAILAAWSVIWDTLNKRQRLFDSEIIAEELFLSNGAARKGVRRKVVAAMRALVTSIQQYDTTEESAINSLIGLGSGLTPSGDDLLIGYMAGLWCTVFDRNERMQFVSNLGKTIIHLSSRTNDISYTYLYHAVQGQVSSRLASLAEAICRGEKSDRLVNIAETAMQVGHTSGMDTVTGLLTGLITWTNPVTAPRFVFDIL